MFLDTKFSLPLSTKPNIFLTLACCFFSAIIAAKITNQFIYSSANLNLLLFLATLTLPITALGFIFKRHYISTSCFLYWYLYLLQYFDFRGIIPKFTSVQDALYSLILTPLYSMFFNILIDSTTTIAFMVSLLLGCFLLICKALSS